MGYQAYTLASLRPQLTAGLTGDARWTLDEMRRALNRTFRSFNLLTSYWKTRTVLPTVAAQVYYTTPAPLSHNLRIAWNERPLHREVFWGLDRLQSGWETDTTASGGDVPVRPTFWMPVGALQFAIWPSDAVGANGLQVDGVMTTPALQLDADYVNLGQDIFSPLLAVTRLDLLGKGRRDQWRATQGVWREFYQCAAAFNPAIKDAPAFARYFATPESDETSVSADAGLQRVTP